MPNKQARHLTCPGEGQGGRYTATGKRKIKTPPWRKADPKNHPGDIADTDQLVVNKEPSLWRGARDLSEREFCSVPFDHVVQARIRCLSRKVDIRLPGQRNSNSHSARPVY